MQEVLQNDRLQLEKNQETAMNNTENVYSPTNFRLFCIAHPLYHPGSGNAPGGVKKNSTVTWAATQSAKRTVQQYNETTARVVGGSGQRTTTNTD